MVVQMLDDVFVKKFFLLILCVWLFLTCEGRASQSKALNKKNVIKTIKSSDGDVFDCVDMLKQPSFDHPLLKDHKLQMKPTFQPKGPLDVTLPENLFSQFEEECPDGYVPIQRLDRSGFTEGSNYSLGLSAPFLSTQDSQNGIKAALAGIKTVQQSFGWLGGGAVLNVYGLPEVGPSQAVSTAFWVINKKAFFGPAILIAGWMVNPTIYGDSKTRLSITWSLNSSVATCYDLRCPGFVQINKKIYLGATIQPLSVYKGQQIVISVYIYKDVVTNNWWFSFGSPTNYVGYWAKEAFPAGFDVFDVMSYTGYVANSQNGTFPPMGNGHYPSKQGDNTACFISNVVRSNPKMEMTYIYPIEQYTFNTNSDCYGVGDYTQIAGQDNYWFSFGGPACNVAKCIMIFKESSKSYRDDVPDTHGTVSVDITGAHQVNVRIVKI